MAAYYYGNRPELHSSRHRTTRFYEPTRKKPKLLKAAVKYCLPPVLTDLAKYLFRL
jgi:hypothetical protein